jgi:predicted GNAT family acetyltransferase
LREALAMSAAIVVERYRDADAFLAAAESWLLEAEAENNLLLGIAQSAHGRTEPDPARYWAGLLDGTRIVGCACRTPPHLLVLSRMPAGASAVLVDDVGAVYPSLNGVNGPTADAEAFARCWIARHGGTSRTRFRMRLYELTRMSMAPPPSGSLRKATEADLPLAREWVDEYVRDVGLPVADPDMAQRLIGREQLFLWVDAGNPRSMLASTRETRSGCAINTVYTPPRFRRSGYATAAVAALSDALLKSGRRFCCLYTDLANPTSNSIYAKIGYRPIRDDVEIEFVVRQ